MNVYSALPNVVLLIHLAFVAFIVVGLVVIWIGYWRDWSFVRSVRFRLLHLLAMFVVLLESLAGIVCPLTTWEDQLRLRAGQGQGYPESFIQYWVGRVLFYDFGERVFTMIYAGVFAAIVLAFWLVPPGRRH